MSIRAALDAAEPVGLLPQTDGPVAAALGTLLADERLAAGERPVTMGRRLRGSMAGGCARAVAFQVIGYPPDLDLETGTLIAFRTGSDLHDMVQEALVTHMGARIEVPIDLAPEFDMGVNADAIYPDTAVEAKTMQPYAFDLATGVRKRAELPGPKAEHLLQAGFAALAPSVNARRIHMIYMCKATGRLAEWLIGVDDPLPHLEDTTVREMVAAEMTRMRKILARIDAGELPKPVVPGHGLVTDPPARESKGQPWNCRYCRWQPTCKTLGSGVVRLSALTALNTSTEQGA